ncbi:MAG TPA: cytochrome b/b6 domain-containing protein [Acidimicrobiales bacterium]|nr:cytochrome b/b6 domain-containing protein [Acidimicrobiales bacterium]
MTRPSADRRHRQAGAASSPRRQLLRFDRAERSAHWANALLFTILMLTALPLYFPGVEAVVGRRALVAEIHTWAGIVLPVPLIVAMSGRWGAGLRRDIRRFNLWTHDEIRWLVSLGRRATPRFDKFNPGQKLNAVFTAGAIVVMLATGLVLKWVRVFPLQWRTGATFVHDVLAAAIFVVVVGHVAFALTHRDALRAIVKGWVSEAWAARHAEAWLEEERASAPAAASGTAAAPHGAEAAAAAEAARSGPAVPRC